MGELKRCLVAVSFFDHTHIENYLERMAGKGWILCELGTYIWTFERIPARYTNAKLRYQVCYAPKASAFDPEQTEEQQEYIEFCEQTGWRFAAANGKLEVFYTDREDAISIHTDPAAELETIHRAAKKAFLPAYGLLLLIAVFQLGMIGKRSTGDLIGVLSDPNMLFAVWSGILLLTLCGGEVLAYYIWRARARNAAGRGEFLDTPNTSGFQIFLFTLLLLSLIPYLVGLIVGSNPLMQFIMLLMGLYMTLLFGAVNGTRVFLRMMRVPASVNRSMTLMVDVIAAFGLMMIIAGVVRQADREGWFLTDKETYQWDGVTYLAPHDPLPLSVEELYGVYYENGYMSSHTAGATFLLAQYVGQQRARLDAPDMVNMPWLYYRIVEVRAGFPDELEQALYSACEEQFLEERSEEREGTAWLSVDATLWNAHRAYQLTWQGMPMARGEFLLCYEKRLVFIQFCVEEPTPEQMRLVAQKLGAAQVP